MEETPLEAEQVDAALRAAGVGRPPPVTAALTAFVNLLSRWNRVYNLTGTGGNRHLVERHLVESLALEPLIQGTRVADVGSGGGFPGIPLAISAPERRFTLIESRAKRARFLRHAVATLGLANATVAHSRAEDLRGEAPFDTVLARAVASPPKLLEIVRALTAPGGIVLVLTSAERAASFERAGGGFTHRPAPPGAARLESAIVVLERNATH